MKKIFVAVLGLLIALGTMAADPGRTDLSREVYVESSKPDFDVAVTRAEVNGDGILVFQIKTPTAGVHTLLCFFDGRFWMRQEVKLPGPYKLNTRGLAPGSHNLTLQVVDKAGQLGVFHQKIEK
jgi:hypothetical protein